MDHDKVEANAGGCCGGDLPQFSFIKKQKEVNSSLGKCKKLLDCMLSCSYGTWTYLQAVFAWEGNMCWYTQPREFLEGMKDNCSL